MKSENNSEAKRPLEWFENRIGTFIFRAPYFKDEVDRGRPVMIKVSTKQHAKQLHDLQRGNRPPYADKETETTVI